MNRTRIIVSLLALSLAACSSVSSPEGAASTIGAADGWGTTNPSSTAPDERVTATPNGPGDRSDAQGAGWQTQDVSAPGPEDGGSSATDPSGGPETGGSTGSDDEGQGGADDDASGEEGSECGDGTCGADEDCASCPSDCGACCGDGACDADETCAACPDDCGECPPTCGDWECIAPETCESCPGDCGECPEAVCGDGVCDAAEGCEDCPADCGACGEVPCGDGICGEAEDCESCADDCGACPQTCCEAASCNPAFEECLPTDDGEGCYCDPIYELCLFMGDDCPPGFEQPEPFTCVDYGGVEGICRIACEGPPIGQPDTCEGADWLCGALPGDDGYCLPADCTGYFDNDFSACGPDATCLPTLDGTNVCVPDGPDDEGDSCGMHNECGHGLLCIDNTCAFGECSADSNQVPCAEGISCLGWTVGVEELSVGNCASECIVFTDTGCAPDEWCFPLANTPEEGPIDGYCVPSGGTAFEGMKCDLDPNACVDGTMCVVSPENPDATCEPLCTPSAPEGELGSCSPGRGCSPLFLVNGAGKVEEVMDYGSCIPSCKPWIEPGLSGCGGDTWCQPMLFNSHAGECKGVFGELEEGDDCTEVGLQNSCGVGLFCLGFMTPAGMDGTCHRLCDVDGGLGATCQENQLCDEINFTGANDKQFAVAVGVCVTDPAWVDPQAISYASHAQPILGDKCAGCHTGGGAGGHDIASVYTDAIDMAAHPSCEGLTIGECALVRIASGEMPLTANCGGPVADDAPNASECVTVTEYATLEQWVSGGMLQF